MILLPVRRTFVGRRGLVAGIGGLAHLGLRPGETVRQLRNLARQLEDDPVLLLHVALEESQTFFEVLAAGIHEKADLAGVSRGASPGVF
jgi:hypothetical protein